MATSVFLSYGFIEKDARIFVIVNARPGDRQLDVVIMMDSLLTGTPESTKVVMVNILHENIESALRDVRPSFVTYQVELVANKGVVSRARFVSMSEPCELLDAKIYRKPSMWIAGFVSWYESFRFNDVFSMEKAIIGAIVKVILSKENVKAEDICTIPREEFQEDQSIGTLDCKHIYHTNCIIKRLKHKRTCLTCRATFFPYRF
ncbi:zinc finger, RING/FYVE/PHD-type containing protein [Tanacetum coccineum]